VNGGTEHHVVQNKHVICKGIDWGRRSERRSNHVILPYWLITYIRDSKYDRPWRSDHQADVEPSGTGCGCPPTACDEFVDAERDRPLRIGRCGRKGDTLSVRKGNRRHPRCSVEHRIRQADTCRPFRVLLNNIGEGNAIIIESIGTTYDGDVDDALADGFAGGADTAALSVEELDLHGKQFVVVEDVRIDAHTEHVDPPLGFLISHNTLWDLESLSLRRTHHDRLIGSRHGAGTDTVSRCHNVPDAAIGVIVVRDGAEAFRLLPGSCTGSREAVECLQDVGAPIRFREVEAVICFREYAVDEQGHADADGLTHVEVRLNVFALADIEDDTAGVQGITDADVAPFTRVEVCGSVAVIVKGSALRIVNTLTAYEGTIDIAVLTLFTVMATGVGTDTESKNRHHNDYNKPPFFHDTLLSFSPIMNTSTETPSLCV